MECCCASASAVGGFHFHHQDSRHHILHRSNLIAQMPHQFHRPTAKAAAAAGSGASSPSSSYFAEPLLGVEKKQERGIAGIDQDELVDPSELADPDSCFLEFKGVQIHHKICEHHQDETSMHRNQSYLIHNQTTKLGFPIILLHGFGASLFTWGRAMKPLALATASKVIAFDRPAFGLTSRSRVVDKYPHSGTSAAAAAAAASNEDMKSLNPYSMAFSVLATLTFIDSLAADKAILIGHSAGSLVAVNTYFEAPERVAALILIAPAIIAPRTLSKDTKKNNKSQRENRSESSEPTSSVQQKQPITRIGNILSMLSTYIVQPVARMLKGMVNMVSSVYTKVLTAFLRSTIAAMLLRLVVNKFGIAAVRNAWYDANQITDDDLNGYTKPLKIKDWDRALLEYTVSVLTDSASRPPLSKRLNEISCPVLIIAGDSDRIVPAWNAERLSKAIPGSSLEIINKCGHLPHEEKVQEFVSVVNKFLQQRVFGAPPEEQQLVQVASS